MHPEKAGKNEADGLSSLKLQGEINRLGIGTAVARAAADIHRPARSRVSAFSSGRSEFCTVASQTLPSVPTIPRITISAFPPITLVRLQRRDANRAAIGRAGPVHTRVRWSDEDIGIRAGQRSHGLRNFHLLHCAGGVADVAGISALAYGKKSLFSTTSLLTFSRSKTHHRSADGLDAGSKCGVHSSRKWQFSLRREDCRRSNENRADKASSGCILSGKQNGVTAGPD